MSQPNAPHNNSITSHHSPTTMAKHSTARSRPLSSSFYCLNEWSPYLGAALLASLLLLSLWSLSSPTKPLLLTNLGGGGPTCADPAPNLRYDPEGANFYDDPELSYSLGGRSRVTDWDEKRREWLHQHPSFAAGSKSQVLMVTGSQPKPCKNRVGDHLLLRLFKNKVDYCRTHGYDIFYDDVPLHPKMGSYWAKYPAVKAAMLAHPEAEWIWWVDSDAVITDMEFELPLERYNREGHNLVVHGWAGAVFEKKSWTGLNAGVFLLRNCQWSMDFIEEWARMGPASEEYPKWGRIQKSVFKDKLFPESDDQTGLAYMLVNDRALTRQVYLEGEYYLEGYWVEIVPTYENITERYAEVERRDPRLRRRHAEKVGLQYGAFREGHLRGAGGGRGSWRRPFVTHFTGCQPCNGDHNAMYEGDQCWEGMVRALNFADNQVLRKYGFFRPDLKDSQTVVETPFDFPEEGPW